MALCITAALAVICYTTALSVVYSNDRLFEPIKLALVDSADTNLSRIAISYVKNQPSIGALLNIETVDSERAFDGFENGDYSAIILLPEDYIGNITSGKECEARIILSEALESNSDTVYALAKLGEHILSAGQKGVFAGQHLIWQYGLDSDTQNRYLALSNLALINEAASSYNNYFDIEMLSYGNSSLDLTGFYLCAYLTFFIIIIGVFFGELYKKDMIPSLIRRLRSCGMSDFGYMLGKIIYPLSFRIFMLVLALFAVSSFVPLQLGVKSVLAALFGIVTVTIFTSCIMVGTFRHNAGAFLLALMSVGLFLCGGIVNRAALPTVICAIGDVTPFGVFMSLIKPLFGGQASFEYFALAVIYTAAAALICKIRLKNASQKENG